MRVVRSEELNAVEDDHPAAPGALVPHWLEGPFNTDRLDVGLVTVGEGGATPPHFHNGGQVMIVTAGQGFVETDGERVIVGPGDVIICQPGELHTHGALPDGPLTHLTVTTGGYVFPDPPSAT